MATGLNTVSGIGVPRWITLDPLILRDLKCWFPRCGLRYIMAVKSLGFALLLVLAEGCVYSFTGPFPQNLRKTHVAVFENRTTRQNLQTMATDAFVKKIRQDGRLEIVGESDAALLISGRITGFSKTPEEYDESGKILSYKITVSAVVSFHEKDQDKAYLKDATYKGWATYNPSSQSEEQATETALEDLADRALSALFSTGF